MPIKFTQKFMHSVLNGKTKTILTEVRGLSAKCKFDSIVFKKVTEGIEISFYAGKLQIAYFDTIPMLNVGDVITVDGIIAEMDINIHSVGT
jgi:hypothetical protein